MAKKTELKSSAEKATQAPKPSSKAATPRKPAVAAATEDAPPPKAAGKAEKKSLLETVKEKVAEVFSGEKKAPSHEEIQLQAYFVAERRRAEGLPGDAASDWIEAERQLHA